MICIPDQGFAATAADVLRRHPIDIVIALEVANGTLALLAKARFIFVRRHSRVIGGKCPCTMRRCVKS